MCLFVCVFLVDVVAVVVVVDVVVVCLCVVACLLVCLPACLLARSHVCLFVWICCFAAVVTVSCDDISYNLVCNRCYSVVDDVSERCCGCSSALGCVNVGCAMLCSFV